MPGSRPVSDAIRCSAVSLHSRGVTEPGPNTATPSRRTGKLPSFRINHCRLITHPALTPLMAIEGQVQYLQVLACLVPTRKAVNVNQYLLSPQLMDMGAPTLAHLPPAKAGHLSVRGASEPRSERSGTANVGAPVSARLSWTLVDESTLPAGQFSCFRWHGAFGAWRWEEGQTWPRGGGVSGPGATVPKSDPRSDNKSLLSESSMTITPSVESVHWRSASWSGSGDSDRSGSK